MRFHTV